MPCGRAIARSDVIAASPGNAKLYHGPDDSFLLLTSLGSTPAETTTRVFLAARPEAPRSLLFCELPVRRSTAEDIETATLSLGVLHVRPSHDRLEVLFNRRVDCGSEWFGGNTTLQPVSTDTQSGLLDTAAWYFSPTAASALTFPERGLDLRTEMDRASRAMLGKWGVARAFGGSDFQYAECLHQRDGFVRQKPTAAALRRALAASPFRDDAWVAHVLDQIECAGLATHGMPQLTHGVFFGWWHLVIEPLLDCWLDALARWTKSDANNIPEALVWYRRLCALCNDGASDGLIRYTHLVQRILHGLAKQITQWATTERRELPTAIELFMYSAEHVGDQLFREGNDQALLRRSTTEVVDFYYQRLLPFMGALAAVHGALPVDSPHVETLTGIFHQLFGSLYHFPNPAPREIMRARLRARARRSPLFRKAAARMEAAGPPFVLVGADAWKYPPTVLPSSWQYDPSG